MILDIHTSEEMYKLDNETSKITQLESIAKQHNDMFLKIYASTLRSKLNMELDKYQYLVGINVNVRSTYNGVITEIRRFYGDSVLVRIKTGHSISSKTLKEINQID